MEKPRYRVLLSHPNFDERDSKSDRAGLLDWRARFGRRSPLSRKIITFNLVALGVLLTGVLYLNQFQGGLVDLRTKALESDARLIAHLVAHELAEGDRSSAIDTLRNAERTGGLRVVLYDTSGQSIAVVDPDAGEGAVPAPTGGQQSAYVAIMNDVWERLSRLFAASGAGGATGLSPETAQDVVERSLSGRSVERLLAATPAGAQVVSIVMPVMEENGGPVYGAILVSTRPGDVDSFVRAEREKILQVFALATITSIFLSLLLANTIVRPLRDLSEAAHKGGTRNARQVNPERINIPDMSNRPDEIGYLSSAMRLMTAALYDRIEANESFAADVAHEIKNPLTSLRSAVETMPYARTDADRDRLLGIIKQDVDRLDRLVTDISNASRLDSELVRDRMEPFDLAQLLSNLIAFNEELAARRGVRLASSFHAQPLVITGLEGRLAQVFVNLITNAVSFSEDGDTITIRTEELGRHRVRVIVEDQGPGIPDENLSDVFERFYSQRPDAEDFGNHSGLGLAISRQIVEAHGGEIWAENIRPAGAGREGPSQGARFVVELPV
ncbi:sensor histidine kinase [Halovulum dunhuangense]|uniref:histidine kinase n=1 Tax=Halovulum dunhuangense TaxID=1505036 RepID=A0A849L5U0_9RHOB|nr:sensor histidine kinase [Halovulum dunhuangense]NNU81542.1 sensor histidine kinase [Halovulum dunhuangense]